MANLLPADGPPRLLPTQDFLGGATVSSLYRLRDMDSTDAGFFIFDDLIVLHAGHYRLHFSLFEIVKDTVQNRKVILSDPFVVYTPKQFPGHIDSTFLSRTFSDQGVKIRIRKYNRTSLTKKRKADDFDTDQDVRHSSSISPPTTTTPAAITAPKATTAASRTLQKDFSHDVPIPTTYYGLTPSRTL